MAIGQHVAKALAAKAAEKEDEMAIDDPKTRQRDEPESGMAAVLAQMAALQQQTMALIGEMRAQGNTGQSTVLEKMLEQQQALLVKTRPENAESHGRSEYRPMGTAAYPDLALKCKMTWVGYELTADTLRPDEIHWLNQLTPGDNFRVTKADGTKIPFKVTAKYSQTYDEGTRQFVPEQLDVWFPCKGEHRQNHLSLVSYCQQAVNGSIPSTDELLREVAKLRAELESAKAGVVGVV